MASHALHTPAFAKTAVAVAPASSREPLSGITVSRFARDAKPPIRLARLINDFAPVRRVTGRSQASATASHFG